MGSPLLACSWSREEEGIVLDRKIRLIFSLHVHAKLRILFWFSIRSQTSRTESLLCVWCVKTW